MSDDAPYRDTVNAYLSDFTSALVAHLRPARGQLGPEWLGLDRAKRSMLVRWSAHGFSAYMIDSWLGEPVVAKSDPDGGIRIRKPFRHIPAGPGDQTLMAVAMKQIRPEATATIALAGNYDLEVSLTALGALGMIGPECVTAITIEQLKALGASGTSRIPKELWKHRATPPWTVGFISRGPTANLLDGFDPDPILLARGIADTILHMAGLREDPVVRYRTAAAELRVAVASFGTTNERSLQQLLETKPWILVAEGEYEVFQPRRELPFEERLGDGSIQTGTIIPDFLFDLYDHNTLVVEIEAATKRLLTTKQQTSFSLPSAQTVASLFQILNYSRIIDGPRGALIRRAMGKPDTWGFEYLLVVGSKLQRDFDERSWSTLRDHLRAAGVTLRTWDYYIDRLQRLAAMADFKPSTPSG